MSRTIEDIQSFPSKSTPGKSYSVSLNIVDGGEAWRSCNCPAWTTNKSNRGKQAWEREYCRHISALSADSERRIVAAIDEKDRAGWTFNVWVDGRMAFVVPQAKPSASETARRKRLVQEAVETLTARKRPEPKPSVGPAAGAKDDLDDRLSSLEL